MAEKRKRRRENDLPPEAGAQQPPPLPPFPWKVALGSALGLLVIYSLTLHPSIPGGDSGELIATAATWGIPHPPGYPLVTMLGALASQIPIGSVAERINWLNALFQASACGLLAAAVTLWTSRAAAGVAAAALFGLSSLAWRYGVTAEVFALNDLFVAGLLLWWVRWEQGRRFRDLCLAFFWSGLALSNHHTFVFVAAPLLVRMLWVTRSTLSAKTWAAVIGLGALGLAPYLYLPIAASFGPAIAWGAPNSWNGFVSHLLRREYGTLGLGAPGTGNAFLATAPFASTLALFIGQAVRDLLWIGPGVALLGFVAAYRDRSTRTLALVGIAPFCLYVTVFCALSNINTEDQRAVHVLSRFILQSNLLIAFWFGIGWSRLSDFARARLPMPARLGSFSSWAAVAVVATIAFVVHREEGNQRDNYVIERYCRNVLNAVSANAILLTRGDHLFGGLAYLQQVEGVRPDVRVLDRELLGFSWYVRQVRKRFPDVVLPAGDVSVAQGPALQDFLDANLPTHAVYSANGLKPGDNALKARYAVVPLGLVDWVIRKDPPLPVEDWMARDAKAIRGYEFITPGRYADGSWEDAVAASDWSRNYTRGTYALEQGLASKSDPPIHVARALLEAIVARSDQAQRLGLEPASPPPLRPLKPSVHVYKNLGLVYQKLSGSDSTLVKRAARAWELYLRDPPANDADVASIRQYVDGHL